LIYSAYSQDFSLRFIVEKNSNQRLVSDTIMKFEQLHHVQDFISNTQKELIEKGFLEASIDSVTNKVNDYVAYCYIGEQYKWGVLLMDHLPAGILLKANVNQFDYKDKLLTPRSIAKLTNKLLNYCDEHGFPFANISFKKISLHNQNTLEAQMHLELGPFRSIDSIQVTGDATISKSFLYKYLDIEKGKPYNETRLKQISKKIKAIPYIFEYQPWDIIFKPGDTRLSLYLNEKKSNQLNAIVGIMPNSDQNSKMVITGDVQLALHNRFAQGESIQVSYQNLQPKSPRLKADIMMPYLFSSPFGVDANFDLFTNALNFRKLTATLGGRYQYNGTNYLKLFYQSVSNRLIEIDTSLVISSKTLSSNIDNQLKGFGVEWCHDLTDYKWNPRKGQLIKLSTIISQRKYLKNNAITSIKDGSGFDYESLYDTILTKSGNHLQLSGLVEQFIPISKSFVLKLSYSGAYIAAPQLYRNELFQIGGFRNLRGFDEQSIFANHYHLTTIEFRTIIGEQSYLFLFTDNAWIETKYQNYLKSSIYNGLGIGGTIQTKSGLFSLSVAVGRNDDYSFRLRSAKLSFGYISLF
jgi:outer membrane protein assembly factor BamA